MKEKAQDIAQLLARLEKLEAEVKLLRAENAELKRRLNMNSQNSSKPPSSDGPSKLASSIRNSLRPKGKHKSGGQPGHQGNTLEQVAAPDQVIRHALKRCSKCFADVSMTACMGIEKRQVFDVPLPVMQSIEHQVEIKQCPCCRARIKSAFPKGVNAPVQYGPNIKSWAVYLQHQHFIPEERLQEVFTDLFGVPLCSATFNGFNVKLYDALEGFEALALKKVTDGVLTHLDETGFRIGGKTQWLHVACNQEVTYYHVSPKRTALLEGLQGVVVHDYWRPYFKLPNVTHALCNAHHLRELNARIEGHEGWARKMKRLLCFGFKLREHYQDEAIPPDKLNRVFQLYDRIVREGFRLHDSLPGLVREHARGRVANRAGHNFLMRLRMNRLDVLRFLTDPMVPFTNNQAERDIRMMKCKQKISGGFRSWEGAQQFARIRGFISTVKKQGWNVLESLSSAMTGKIPVLV